MGRAGGSCAWYLGTAVYTAVILVALYILKLPDKVTLTTDLKTARKNMAGHMVFS